MKTSVVGITGPWDTGFTLDAHTTGAQFLGYNTAGHPQFDTQRSEIGEALYRAKYQSDKKAAVELAVEAAKQIRRAKLKVEVIVPVPPSKKRAYQPLIAIATRLAVELDVDFDDRSLCKIKDTPELKSMDEIDERKQALAGAFEVRGANLRDRSVLLFDDLYRSGASMAEAARTIKKQGKARLVSAVALTRTRTKT